MENKYYEIPFPPSYWDAFYRKKRFDTKSEEYKIFIYKTEQALNKSNFKAPIGGEMELHLVLCGNWYTKAVGKKAAKIRRKDLDNYLKCIIDTLTKYIRKTNDKFDDCLLFAIYAEKKQASRQCVFFSLNPRQPRYNEGSDPAK